VGIARSKVARAQLQMLWDGILLHEEWFYGSPDAPFLTEIELPGDIEPRGQLRVCLQDENGNVLLEHERAFAP